MSSKTLLISFMITLMGGTQAGACGDVFNPCRSSDENLRGINERFARDQENYRRQTDEMVRQQEEARRPRHGSPPGCFAGFDC